MNASASAIVIEDVDFAEPSSRLSSAVVRLAPSSISNSASRIAAEPIVNPVSCRLYL